MLTISNDRHNSLSIQKKERFWSRTLILAFFLALTIHGTGLLLFNIKSVTCRQCQIILDPLTVVMEIPVLIQQEILANLNDTQVRIPSRPQHIPKPPLVHENSPLPIVTFSFCQKKKILTPPAPEMTPSIFITLLGPLADRQFIDAPDEIDFSRSPQTTHYYVTIDNRTGKILWIDPLDDLGETLIQWHFEPFEGEILTKGELEVSIR